MYIMLVRSYIRNIDKDKKKLKAMELWCSSQNNSFINRMGLPLLCEKSEAIPLVLVGFSAGRQSSRQSDEILVNIKIVVCILHD